MTCIHATSQSARKGSPATVHHSNVRSAARIKGDIPSLDMNGSRARQSQLVTGEQGTQYDFHFVECEASTDTATNTPSEREKLMGPVLSFEKSLRTKLGRFAIQVWTPMGKVDTGDNGNIGGEIVIKQAKRLLRFSTYHRHYWIKAKGLVAYRFQIRQ